MGNSVSKAEQARQLTGVLRAAAEISAPFSKAGVSDKLEGQKEPMAITIKDVARLAGVSISTVSKVINDSPRISRETKDRVRKIMEDLNYFPNRIARSFVQQSTFTVGVLMELKEGYAFENPYVYEILGGIEAEAYEKGYNVTLCNLRFMKDRRQSLERLIAEKRVDGLLVHCSPSVKDIVDTLIAQKFPFVMIGQPDQKSARFSWIDINNSLAGEVAAAELFKAGYERPAFIGGLENEGISARRQEGFERMLVGRGLAILPALIKRGAGNDRLAGRKLMAELLDEGRNFDSLVCASNFLAWGALEVLKERSVRIPEDVGLFTFDNFPLAEYTYPPLSVVDIRLFDLGVRAARHLFEKIRDPELSIQAQFLNFNVVLRESSAGPGRAGIR